MSRNDDEITAEFEFTDPDTIGPSADQVRVECDFGALSDPGKVRKNNEDHYLISRCGRVMEAVATNLDPGEIKDFYELNAYGLVVADGMGGAAAGEIASGLAIRTLIGQVLEVPDWILKFDAGKEEEAMRRADGYYRKVHDALVERSAADPSLAGMGTTMTMATIIGTDGILAHVGDSRAYLYRNDQLMQLTRDQTQAQLLLDAGVINEEEFARHQYRHVLYQAMGQQGNLQEVEIQRLRFQHDDRLLLCSDGLTDMVDDETIAAVLGAPGSAQDMCNALLAHALTNGGKDNVTIVLSHITVP